MIRKELKSTKEKPTDKKLKYKSKTNIEFCKTVDPSTTQEGKTYSYRCGRSPTTSNKGNTPIYLIFIYDCNASLTKETKNRSDKEMIRSFTEQTEYFKSSEINPEFNFIDNEAPTAFKMTMVTMDIKYQLVPPSILIATMQRETYRPSKNTS